MTNQAKAIQSKLEALKFRASSLADSDQRVRSVSFDTSAYLTITESERDWLISLIDKVVR